MTFRVRVLLGLVSLATLVGADPDSTWRVARPGYEWDFPADHWAHPGYQTEWWYFTGHLDPVGEGRPRFGYQFTFFKIGISSWKPELSSRWASQYLIMGHASVVDFDSGRHFFSDLLYREADFLAGPGEYPDPRIAWSRGPAGTKGEWILEWNGDGFDVEMKDREQGVAFHFTTRPLKPLVLQGPGGFSRKSYAPGRASLYYSFTRLHTRGEMKLEGESRPVEGTSWMDHEISSSQLGELQVGWDWFGLQLDDGRDLMLYLLRREDGSIDYQSGTLISTSGDTTILPVGSWSLRSTRSWTSPQTGTIYPSRWELEIPSLEMSLEVVPRVAAQENVGRRSARLHYWEGAVEVRDAKGKAAGRGYVELTGYGKGNRPPL